MLFRKGVVTLFLYDGSTELMAVAAPWEQGGKLGGAYAVMVQG